VIGIVAGMMIGLCLVIMEQGARKAHITTKGRCMDQKPSDVAKIGDRVRILKGYLYSDNVEKTGTVTHFWSDGDADVILNNGIETIASKVEVIQPVKEQTMTRQTFKVGDKVKLARVNPSPDGYIFTTVGMTGKVVDPDGYFNGGSGVKVAWDQLDGNSHRVYRDHLELLHKTLDNLVEGDVVVDKDDADNTMTVDYVLKPGLYVLLDSDEDTLLYNAKELACRGFIPQQDPEGDKTRLTVAEVAKKLGLNPDKLHIVADKEAA